jgi:hypothetical protein
MIGWALIIILILIIAIYVFIEFKRFRHKLFAIFLIVLILFLYLSGLYVFSGKDVDYKSVPGILNAGKLYFSWLSTFFSNLKGITSNAIRMDWKGNITG